MKPHFTGATYDLTQENMNHLIAQLEQSNRWVSFLESALNTYASILEAIRENISPEDLPRNFYIKWRGLAMKKNISRAQFEEESR